MIDKIIPFVNIPSDVRNLPDLKKRNKQKNRGDNHNRLATMKGLGRQSPRSFPRPRFP